MNIIESQSTSPYFNIAAEEYFLKESKDNFFLLYRNSPSVITGKHQNPLAEINLQFIRENQIHVARRFSGGGTVYHDLGNINYAFITTGISGQFVDFRKYVLPVIDFLSTYGIKAKSDGYNNLTTGGRKFSGNARHVCKNRTLHHGTLMYSVNLENLNSALYNDQEKYNSKAVRSVKAGVVNLSDLIQEKIDIQQFSVSFKNCISRIYNGREYSVTAGDIQKIQELSFKKFSTWQWNFGYSPDYVFHNKILYNNSVIMLSVSVENGIILNISISTDTGAKFHKIEKQLTGARHDFDTIFNILKNCKFDGIFQGISSGYFVNAMF